MFQNLARTLTRSLRTLPDYLVIGAQKAGTTSLQRDLESHPQVAPASVKEVHYFDVEFSRGEDWYRSHFPTSWARRIAAANGRPLLTGDATPYYLFHPLAPERARCTVPEARLIVLLRDPVERAHSHYHHEVRLGFERASFREAIEREPERLAGEVERMLADSTYVSLPHQHHSYVARGMYAAQLRAWWKHFPRERTLVLTAEELASQPEQTYERVLRFLDLPPHLPAGFSWLNATGRRELDPQMHRRLRDLFEPHVRELEDLLGRSLPWGLTRRTEGS